MCKQNEEKNMKRYASLAELAELLDISASTLSRMVRDGRIPYLRIGKLLRFDVEEVIEHFRAA